MNVNLLLQQQGLSVRQLALELEVPLKTVQDWVYRGVVPSPSNQAKLDEVVPCAHHWIIETPDGPVSTGRCRLCGEEREFSNSVDTYGGWTNRSGKVKMTGSRNR
jgi:hypothetical protein